MSHVGGPSLRQDNNKRCENSEFIDYRYSLPASESYYPTIKYGNINKRRESCVSEPPPIWAAPAVRGPGADSGSDQIGSAQAPGKKRRLQAASAPCTNNFHFELLSHVLSHTTRLSFFQFFACQKDAAEAGTALKRRLRLLALAHKQIGSGSHLQKEWWLQAALA